MALQKAKVVVSFTNEFTYDDAVDGDLKVKSDEELRELSPDLNLGIATVQVFVLVPSPGGAYYVLVGDLSDPE
jgi:hypothetical protein